MAKKVTLEELKRLAGKLGCTARLDKEYIVRKGVLYRAYVIDKKTGYSPFFGWCKRFENPDECLADAIHMCEVQIRGPKGQKNPEDLALFRKYNNYGGAFAGDVKALRGYMEDMQ